MQIRILGSAAGGGFPQWNCGCRTCMGLRAGSLTATARTQTQLAFSPDGQVWFLLGAYPDLRTQILATPELAPAPGESSSSPIGGVFLASSGPQTGMGLLPPREIQTFFFFAAPALPRAPNS